MSGWVGRIGWNVFFLGCTSLLTDVSSEMVNAVLPLYLTAALRFSPLQFGLFDGFYQGLTAVLRIWGGLLADGGRGCKQVAAAGYAASALSKLGLVVSASLWLPTTAFLLLDRLGKGIRTPPRDALIALSAGPTHAAEAFGVHRAMDTAGAMIGPLLAFVILSLAPAGFDAVFVVSFAFAVAGLGVLVLFVRNRVGDPNAVMPAVSWRAAVELLRLEEFRSLAIVGAVLSLGAVSDAFLFLVVQRRAELAPGLFPLLPLAVGAAYLLLAIPAGRLADATGRRPVLLAGYGMLLPAYGLLLVPAPGIGLVAAALLLVGAHYAASDGVLMAMASRVLPPARLTSGLAVLTSGAALARLLGSLLFGALWGWSGPDAALLVFAGGLCAALATAALVLGRRS